MTGGGSTRARHATLGDGEIGLEGMIAFLSEPRFEGLPVIFEGPGRAGKEIEPVDMAWAHDLRSRGLAARLAAGEVGSGGLSKNGGGGAAGVSGFFDGRCGLGGGG